MKKNIKLLLLSGLILGSFTAAYLYACFGKHFLTVCNQSDADLSISVDFAGNFEPIPLINTILLHPTDCKKITMRPRSDGYLIISIDGQSKDLGYVTPFPFVTRHHFIIRQNLEYSLDHTYF